MKLKIELAEEKIPSGSSIYFPKAKKSYLPFLSKKLNREIHNQVSKKLEVYHLQLMLE